MSGGRHPKSPPGRITVQLLLETLPTRGSSLSESLDFSMRLPETVDLLLREFFRILGLFRLKEVDSLWN